MSLTKKPRINLRINNRSRRLIKTAKPVRLNETAPGNPTKETKAADKLVIACRENVCFLNFHLQRYEKYIELPALVDNVLYLAYTVRARDNSPLDAFTIRRELAGAGIETHPTFSFVASPEESYTGKAINRIKQHLSRDDSDAQVFCLGCHQYLTILDLQHIVDTFNAIFNRYDNTTAMSSIDQPPGNRR